MPDGKTRLALEPNRFGDEVRLVRSTEISLGFPRFWIFHGYNNQVKGWKCNAVDAAGSIAEAWSSVNYLGLFNIAACLWPGLDGVEKIHFQRARENAVKAATDYYAPLFRALNDEALSKFIFLGHSAGCWLIYNILKNLKGESVKAVIFMNAAMRVSEFDPAAVAAARHWLNFHSRTDAALKLMQLDPIDEAGGWKKWLSDVVRFRFHKPDEKIVGRDGLNIEGIENIDLTEIIGPRHSDARHVPEVWKKIHSVLAEKKEAHG